MIREIGGRQNQSVKTARKLQQKKHRRDRGLLVCEGMDLLVAAENAGAQVVEVLVREDLLEALPGGLRERAEACGSGDVGPHVGVCSQETLEYVSLLGGAADVVTVCELPRADLADIPLADSTVMFLDVVGDPGNVGTLIRGCQAFGLAGVICAPGTADAFGPKAMRAGMGSQFMLPVVTEVQPKDLLARLDTLSAAGETPPAIVVADAHEGADVREVGDSRGYVLVLGAERTGASVEWGEAQKVRIRQCRGESLNVAMAGTILAYEWSRKTRRPGVAN